MRSYLSPPSTSIVSGSRSTHRDRGASALHRAVVNSACRCRRITARPGHRRRAAGYAHQLFRAFAGHVADGERWWSSGGFPSLAGHFGT